MARLPDLTDAAAELVHDGRSVALGLDPSDPVRCRDLVLAPVAVEIDENLPRFPTAIRAVIVEATANAPKRPTAPLAACPSAYASSPTVVAQATPPDAFQAAKERQRMRLVPAATTPTYAVR
jgi:hypothetical protein